MSNNPVLALLDRAGVFSVPASAWVPAVEAGKLGRIYAGLVDDQNGKIAAGADYATSPAPLSARGSQAGIALLPLHWLALAKWIGFWVGMDGTIGAAPAVDVGCRLAAFAPPADVRRLDAMVLHPDQETSAAFANASRLTWYTVNLCDWFGLTVDPDKWRIVNGPKMAPFSVVWGAGAWSASPAGVVLPA